MIGTAALNLILQGLVPTPPLGESYLGYFVFAVFMAPPIILVLSALLGKPRSLKVFAVLVGTLLLVTAAFVVFTFALSYGMRALFFS